MALQWTPDLAVGHPKIDEEHKELFAKINILMDAMNQGKGRDEIGKTITFLGDYVVYHFKNEEDRMIAANYPQYPAHRLQHTEFLKDFMTIRKEFEENGATSLLTIQLQQKVVNWLINHIGKTDRALATALAK